MIDCVQEKSDTEVCNNVQMEKSQCRQTEHKNPPAIAMCLTNTEMNSGQHQREK